MSNFVGPVVPVQDVQAERCRKLWCHVILDAFLLATSTRKGDRGYEQDYARSWFGSPTFYKICAMAGFDGEYILRGYHKKMAEIGEDV